MRGRSEDSLPRMLYVRQEQGTRYEGSVDEDSLPRMLYVRQEQGTRYEGA